MFLRELAIPARRVRDFKQLTQAIQLSDMNRILHILDFHHSVISNMEGSKEGALRGTFSIFIYLINVVLRL